LTSVDNRIDTRTASVALRAEFANPQHRLLPGGNVPVLFARAGAGESDDPGRRRPAGCAGLFSWVLTDHNTVRCAV
jgi:multidrug efflux pump subunit AcrA (membrane-fusion protein)